MTAYEEFITRFSKLTEKNKKIVLNTLSNIFTMRLIGNKTHGDLAEVGIAEFVSQFMYDYSGKHVGKDLYRAKQHEEDIVVTNEITHEEIPISLKAYGDGPLQLSTDKNSSMFSLLETKKSPITSHEEIEAIFNSKAFTEVMSINVMPLIYREMNKQCNIMIFNYDKVRKNTARIEYVSGNENVSGQGRGRTHPIYAFYDGEGNYICEVRYGSATANALQRGFWTNTKRAADYFRSATNGWVDYEHNQEIIKLIRLALNSTKAGHKKANDILQEDIDSLKVGGVNE